MVQSPEEIFSQEEIDALKKYKKQLMLRRRQEEFGSQERQNLTAEIVQVQEKVDEKEDVNFSSIEGRTSGYTEMFTATSSTRFNDYIADGDINTQELSSLNQHYDTVVREYSIASDFLHYVSNLGPKYDHLKDSAKALCARLKYCVQQARMVAKWSRTIYYDQTGELAEVAKKKEERKKQEAEREVKVPVTALGIAGAELLRKTLHENSETLEVKNLPREQVEKIVASMSLDERETSFSEMTQMIMDVYSHDENVAVKNRIARFNDFELQRE